MKKSVVATIAWVSLIRYTAASSLVSMPTSSSFGTKLVAVLARILLEHARGELAAATAAVGEAGEPGDLHLGCVHELLRKANKEILARLLIIMLTVKYRSRKTTRSPDHPR